VIPSQAKLIKCIAMMNHHAIACDLSVLNAVVFDPRLQQVFSLLIAHDYNVQWFHCTHIGYGHQ
jgi:hypothetical protein